MLNENSYFSKSSAKALIFCILILRTALLLSDVFGLLKRKA